MTIIKRLNYLTTMKSNLMCLIKRTSQLPSELVDDSDARDNQQFLGAF